jgi:hypothetical protein
MTVADKVIRDAWAAYSATDEYANSRRWLAHDEHRDGSMWAAFLAGWQAAHDDARARDAAVREDVRRRLEQSTFRNNEGGSGNG